jgi:hypothetical protein
MALRAEACHSCHDDKGPASASLMDFYLKTLSEAFLDTEYQRRSKNFGAFIFILITPANPGTFQEYLHAFNDLHYSTGEDILIVGPSIEVNGRKATRGEIMEFLNIFETHRTSRFKTFCDNQIEQSYHFCKHIGLPLKQMPTLVVFEKLKQPKYFITIDLGHDPSSSLIDLVRGIMDHLRSRCMWSERAELDKIHRDLSARYPERILSSETYRAMLRAQFELIDIKKRLRKAMIEYKRPELLQSFQEALNFLHDKLKNSVLINSMDETRVKTESALFNLRDGSFREGSINVLRKFAKTTRTQEEVQAAFGRFFQIADELYRPDRLSLRCNDVEAKINRRRSRMEEETIRERNRLVKRREELKSYIPAAADPITALNELPFTQLWIVRDTRGSAGWLSELDMTTVTRGSKPMPLKAKAETILFFASNPKDTNPLRLDEEVREIDEGLRRAKHRNQFTLVQKWAVRADDLRRGLLDEKPAIVHFSGHGSPSDGLVCENNQGKAEHVPPEALAELFALCKPFVECVVLNACYSEGQATAIAEHIPYVVGMGKSIGDSAAVKFAVGFYDALGAGIPYDDAFKFGCNAISLSGIPEHQTPQLKKRA